MKAMKKAKVSKATRPPARRGKPSDQGQVGPRAKQLPKNISQGAGGRSTVRQGSAGATPPPAADAELAPRSRGRPKGSFKQLPSAIKASGLAGLAMPVIAQTPGRWIAGDRQASREFWSALESVLPGTILELEARDTHAN